MSAAETSVQAEILRALGTGPTRLFRNNTGQGWVGPSRRIERTDQVMVYAGDVIIRNARPLHAGLCTGSSDLIGWHSVTITPEMVGRTMGLFLGVVVKRPGGHGATEERQRFISAIVRAGGLAGVARSVDDAREILGRFAP